ncbi:MAG: S8 family serine peptidase [Myxococcota bacterium]
MLLAGLLAVDPGVVPPRFDFADTPYFTPHGPFVLEHDRTFLAQASVEDRVQIAKLSGGRAVVAYRIAETGALLLSDGRVLLRAAPWADDAELSRISRRLGAESLVVKDRRRRLMVVQGPAEQALRIAEALLLRDDVEWSHPDFIYRLTTRFAPNDQFYPQQWHHGIILSEGAWDRERGAASVRIAVIDTGVDMEHPDLASKLVAPRDTQNQDNDPSPEPEEAHGTACAGLAAAVTENSEGIAGVCHDCQIIPIRLFAGSGFTRQGADSDAFAWAVDNGAAVISNSWGPADPVPVPFNLEAALQEAAIDARGGAGAVILFAAGNRNRENADFELASHPLVISVGASTESDIRAAYSNFGASLDVLAPAGTVTTDNSGGPADGYTAGDYTSGFGGTSAATPVAAGIAALLISAEPGLSRGQVTSVLLDTADQIGPDPYPNGRNDRYGHGRVNAVRALELVLDGQVCQPVAEVCDNGIDDDCDLAVDDADPNCAPGPGDRCAGAGSVCEPGSVCLPEAAGSDYRCYEICTSSCATGECTPISNDLSVCTDGNDVACPLCGDRIACDSDALCVTFSTFALSLCTQECSSANDCPLGFFCTQLTGTSRRACAPLSFSCSAFGPGAGSRCDGESCALGNVCLNDGMCYALCDTAADCEDAESCVDDGGVLSYCECQCDSSAGCDNDCVCDRDCQLTCQCDESDACDPGCPCDDDCAASCTCDIVGGTCDIGCACDPDCAGQCFCDGTPECDADCVCDDDCAACSCNSTSSCDAGCDCDPDCPPEEEGGGSSSSSGCAGALPALFLFRRRRPRP